MDCRAKPGNDREKNKPGNDREESVILFSSLSSSGKRSAPRGSMDVRGKPEHDIEKKGRG